jgi:hypothetical protein
MFGLRGLGTFILVGAWAVAQQQPSQQMPPDRAAEKSAPAPKPDAKPATAPSQPQTPVPSQAQTDIAKPESDRGDEGVARQQPEALGFRNPNREQLQQKIQNALRNDPTLQGAMFTVNIGEDAIDLSGNANTAKQRLAARRIVQSFAGNLKVRERINVAGATPAPGAPQPNGSVAKPAGPGANADEPPPTDSNRPHNDPKKDGDKSENPR